MGEEAHKIGILLIVIFFGSCLYGQEAFMDPVTKQKLDSLDQRIKTIENEIPRLARTRSPGYFFKQQELDFTIFLSYYTRNIFDEDLESARVLVKTRLNGAKKRKNEDGIEFYTRYQTEINKEIKNQKERYQRLFAKEKNFKREFYRFLNQGDEYSLIRAVRMTDLAIKYAAERNLSEIVSYIKRYNSIAHASLYDLRSEHDLAKLTRNESFFQKQIQPMLESDSIELIKQAGELINYCNIYAANSNSVLDTNYFGMQNNAVNTAISDYYQRKGNNASLQSLGGQSIIARFDTLNREGVYKWHDKILVVGHFKPSAKFEKVKKGEAIIYADHKLAEYIRVNRIAKLKKVIDIGSTFLVPYYKGEMMEDFQFNPKEMKFQYMVCYTRIESQYFTKEVSKLLPLLQFDVETESP